MKTLGILTMFVLGGGVPLAAAIYTGFVDSWQSVLIGAACTVLALLAGFVGMIIANDAPDA